MMFVMMIFLLANTAYSSPGTTIYVDPASLTNPSSPFSVNINISDVSDLYAWEFKLYYKTHPDNKHRHGGTSPKRHCWNGQHVG